MIFDAATMIEIARKGIFILIVIGICYLGYMFVRRGLRYSVERKLMAQKMADILKTIFRYLLILTFLLLSLQQLGVGLGSVWTFVTALLAMIAVGFVAVWSVISNVLCSVILVMTRPFSIGDEIEIIEPGSPDRRLHGRVTNINAVYTTLSEAPGENERSAIVLVPNNIFFQKYVRRIPGQDTHRLDDQLFQEQSLLNDAARDES